jgi:hypothetical protein
MLAHQADAHMLQALPSCFAGQLTYSSQRAFAPLPAFIFGGRTLATNIGGFFTC